MSSVIRHPSSLLLVGHGNMGSAMLESWRRSPAHQISEFYVIDPKHSGHGLFFSDLANFPQNIKPSIIIFAAKPQQMEDILPQYKARFGDSPLYISIAAGKTLEFFTKHLGSDAKIIRAMPNTPALVGKAITGLCHTPNIDELQKAQATSLIESFGKAIWVEENMMDAVTAISGSGPAYVLLFLESLTQAGINAGLAPSIAQTLALEMTHGTIHLASKTPETFEKLRHNVTSKGGTTEAALNILMSANGMEKLMDDAVKAAIKRAKELA
jgi:pyrroline-5-carboxylate reductase